VLLTRRADVMGPLVNHRLTTAAAACVTVLVVTLNGYLLYLAATGRGEPGGRPGSMDDEPGVARSAAHAGLGHAGSRPAE